MWNSLQCLAVLAVVAAADNGGTPSSAALRGPLPLARTDEGEELVWSAEGDGPERQLGSPRRLEASSDVMGWFFTVPFIGCIIWAFLPCLIWNNERMSVKNASFMKKAKDHCVIIDDINVEPPEILVDHVVFATGTTSQKETLVDTIFPEIKADNAVRLRRKVLMYQQTGENDTTKQPIFSWAETRRDFKLNPEMPFPSSSRFDCVQAPAGSVKMGVFYCGAFVRRDMQNWETLDASTIIGQMKFGNLQTAVKDNQVHFAASGGYCDPANPQVGTVAVSFEVLKCGPLAVLGVLEKKDGWSFLPLIHEHCTHSHGLCDDITGKQRQNPHWTGRKEDLPSLKDAVEKIETELTTADRSSLDAQLLTQQTEDFDASAITTGKQMSWFSKAFASMLGHDDFIPLTETSVGYEDFISTTAANATKKTRSNRINFLLCGGCAIWLILAPFLMLLSIPICLPWSGCYMPGAYLLVILCFGGCVCSSSCTAVLMAISMIRFRPLMSVLLFSWFALVVVTLQMMQAQTAEAYPGSNSSSLY